MTEQPRINAKLEVRRRDLIHNDLISTAYHLKRRIDAAYASGGSREGVGLDLLAAVTMLAFSFEAYLNFVGDHSVEGWLERTSGQKKREQIWKLLGLEWDEDQRPASTILKLIKARDMMAHGKPLEFEVSWESEGTHDELEKEVRAYQTEFEKLTNYDFFVMAYEDVESVWKDMQRASGIKVHETFDQGMFGINFISFSAGAADRPDP